MLVVRPVAIVEDRVQIADPPGIGIEPRIDVLRLDRNDAAIVTGGRDFRWRLVGYRGE